MGMGPAKAGITNLKRAAACFPDLWNAQGPHNIQILLAPFGSWLDFWPAEANFGGMVKKLIIAAIVSTLFSTAMAGDSIHSTTVKSIEGKDVKLEDYKGKVVLVVNVASRCGYTPQYFPLEVIHKKYAAKGFAVLGFPCNQFGRQEPGSNEEIQEFCSTKYGVTFPMFAKIEVNGDNRHELYSKLAGDSKIRWNFEKFLVGKDGQVIKRFGSGVEPNSEEVTSAIEKALAE